MSVVYLRESSTVELGKRHLINSQDCEERCEELENQGDLLKEKDGQYHRAINSFMEAGKLHLFVGNEEDATRCFLKAARVASDVGRRVFKQSVYASFCYYKMAGIAAMSAEDWEDATHFFLSAISSALRYEIMLKDSDHLSELASCEQLCGKAFSHTSKKHSDHYYQLAKEHYKQAAVLEEETQSLEVAFEYYSKAGQLERLLGIRSLEPLHERALFCSRSVAKTCKQSHQKWLIRTAFLARLVKDSSRAIHYLRQVKQAAQKQDDLRIVAMVNDCFRKKLV